MDFQNLINSAIQITQEIAEIKRQLYDNRMSSHSNFNFFQAIVSGKYDKVHIEKYHSNFIAYLLDPEASHDFNYLFQDNFLVIINEKLKVLPAKPQVNKNIKFTVKREKSTTEGRMIDIFLESKDQAIFIENKVFSWELTDQVNDYLAYIKDKKNSGIGIYLTLNGDAPNSAANIGYDSSFPIIRLSYADIRCWVESCIADEALNEFKHVKSALEQYKEIIKYLMKETPEEIKKIIDYLNENQNNAKVLIENQALLVDSLNEYKRIKTEEFISKIIENVKNNVENNGNLKFTMDKYWFCISKKKWGNITICFEMNLHSNLFDYGIWLQKEENEVSELLVPVVIKLTEQLGEGNKTDEWPWWQEFKELVLDKAPFEEKIEVVGIGIKIREIVKKMTHIIDDTLEN